MRSKPGKRLPVRLPGMAICRWWSAMPVSNPYTVGCPYLFRRQRDQVSIRNRCDKKQYLSTEMCSRFGITVYGTDKIFDLGAFHFVLSGITNDIGKVFLILQFIIGLISCQQKSIKEGPLFRVAMSTEKLCYNL